MSVVNINLTDLLNEIGVKETQSLLADFSCKKDSDVEFFLKKKAIPFQVTHKSRTTLLCWVDEDSNDFEIIAYFALAPKVFNLDGISQTKQKKIRGGSLPRNKKDNSVPAILIGQIGKNDKATMPISSNALFSQIFLSIKSINMLIGHRLVYLECQDIPKLKAKYESKGFNLLTDSNGTPYRHQADNTDYLVYIITMNNLLQIIEDNRLNEVV